MRLAARTVAITISLSLIGCAPYPIDALTTDHPAHPDGASAAPIPASKTLAYTAADLPARSAAVEQRGHDAHQGSDALAKKTAVGEGKVIAVVPSSGQLVIEHGEIKGFMEAMTMGYSTEPAKLLDGLKPGDKIRFTIDVPKKTIIKIEKMN